MSPDIIAQEAQMMFPRVPRLLRIVAENVNPSDISLTTEASKESITWAYAAALALHRRGIHPNDISPPLRGVMDENERVVCSRALIDEAYSVLNSILNK